jgi:hypothetical protein
MYTISNTNGQNGSKCVVRVYRNGALIAEQFINKRNPLGYIRKHLGSKHRAELKQQCQVSGMTSGKFEDLIA